MLTARCTPRRARPQGETIRSSVTVVGALGHRVSRDRFPTLLPLFGWRTHSPSRQVRRKHSYKLRGTGSKTTVTRTNGHYKENVRGNSECLHGIYKKVSERTSKKKRKRRQPITSETVNAVCPHPRRSFTHDTRPNNAGTHPHKTPNSRSRHTPQRERRRCSSQSFNVFVGVGGGGRPALHKKDSQEAGGTHHNRPPPEVPRLSALRPSNRREPKQREDALGGNTSEIINVRGRSNEGLLIVTA